MSKLIRALSIAVAVSLAFPAAGASGHAERHTVFPPLGVGHVPKFRTSGPMLVVCKPSSTERIAQYSGALRARNEALLQKCKYHDIQAAVDDVKQRGTRIEILPGTYLEKEVLKAPVPKGCETFYKNGQDRDSTNDLLTYEDQLKCPHAVNLIAWFGDRTPGNNSIACDNKYCDLQLEGTGASPEDVVIDGKFKELNVIRADRADGVTFRNFTVQGSTFNGLYVIETNGYRISDVVGRNNNEYGFLTFSTDHGLIENCEAYGNGDSGVYPGGQQDSHGAYPSTEVRDCFSHHNAIGYSGTAGNSTYVHDTVFAYNSTGITTDSFFGGHPGLPEDSAQFVHNRIFSNNEDYNSNYQKGLCAKPYGKWGYFKWHGEKIRNVCPTIPLPIGTGIMIAGGNQNVVGDNWIYDNWRYGVYLFWVPAGFRGDNDPDKQHDTSHANRFVVNRMGVSPTGQNLVNGTDFWWDVEGAGNCWQDNIDPSGITAEPDPSTLPDCDAEPVFYPGPMVAEIAPCAVWAQDNPNPPGCDWMNKPSKPGGSAPVAVPASVHRAVAATPGFTIHHALSNAVSMIVNAIYVELNVQFGIAAHNSRPLNAHFK